MATSLLSLVQTDSNVTIEIVPQSTTLTTTFNEGDGSTISFSLSSIATWTLLSVPAFSQTIGSHPTNILTSSLSLPGKLAPASDLYFPISVVSQGAYYNCYIKIDTQGIVYVVLSLSPSWQWPSGMTISVLSCMIPWFS